MEITIESVHIMGRYYHLSKKVTKAEEKEILKEMKELKDVESVEITDDHAFMKVVTKDDQFSDVMRSAVNICSHVKGDLEISFTRFAYEV